MEVSDNLTCPITLEAYTAKGPLQPRFLPSCGHTFSFVGVQELVRRTQRGQERAKCPICRVPQNLSAASDCQPNWSLIAQVQEQAQRSRASEGAGLFVSRRACPAPFQLAQPATASEASQRAPGSSVDERDADAVDIAPHVLSLNDLCKYLAAHASNEHASRSTRVDLQGRTLLMPTPHLSAPPADGSFDYRVAATGGSDTGAAHVAFHLEAPTSIAPTWVLRNAGCSLRRASLVLPASGYLLIEGTQGSVNISDFRIKGGTVVCAGMVSLHNVEFLDCTLVATDGATISVRSCEFEGGSVALFCTNRATVTAGEVTVRGVQQGAVVQCGAHLSLTQFCCEGYRKYGVEVRGAGSRLVVQDGTFVPEKESRPSGAGARADRLGWKVPGQGAARGSSQGAGSSGQLHADREQGDAGAGAWVPTALAAHRGGKLKALQCDLASAGLGLFAAGMDTRVGAQNCQFVENVHGAVRVQAGAQVKLEESECRAAVEGPAACITGAGSSLRAKGCTFTGGSSSGVVISKRAKATLKECSVTHNQEHGAQVIGAGSVLHIEDSCVAFNQGCGILGAHGAELSVCGCSSEGNSVAAWGSYDQAVLAVDKCSSSNERGGMSADGGSVATLNCVVEDGAACEAEVQEPWPVWQAGLGLEDRKARQNCRQM